MNLFNTNLKVLRDELELSQNEIANVMDITPAKLALIEKGDPNLNCEALTLLCQQHPSVNLNWLIKGLGEPLTSEYRLVTVAESTSAEMSEVRLDNGEYVSALIEFLSKRSKTFPVEPIRAEFPLLPIFYFEERFYLVLIEVEVDEVVKGQLSRCLWYAPQSLLSLYIRESEIKAHVLQIAANFRKNYRFYGSPIVRQLPEVEAFNQLLEALIIDKEEVIDSVYNNISECEILSTNDQKFDHAIRYEGEMYQIYDVTI